MPDIDTVGLQDSLDATNSELSEIRNDIKEEEKLESSNEAALAQRQAELKDSHAAKDAKDFGFKENVKELSNAVVGGARDTISSILTAPERIIDMATGEMAEQAKQEGGYTPDWNPLGNDLNPETKTWWGGLIRGGVHFGTMAIPVFGWAGRISKGTGMLSAATKATVLSGNTIVRGASVGAVSDLFSEYSQDANGLQVMRDRFGFIDTPLTTKDSDHPALKTLKNVGEGLGIGTVADFAWQGIGKARNKLSVTHKTDRNAVKSVDKIQANRQAKAEDAARILIDNNLRAATTQKLFNKGINFNELGVDEQLREMSKVAQADRSGRYRSWNPPEDNVERAARKILERNKSIETQTTEKGLQQLETDEFGGFKNKPIADPWQGNPNSISDPWQVSKDLWRIDKEWGSEWGSTDSLITPAAAESLANNGLGKRGITPAVVKNLIGDTRFRVLMEDLNAKGKSLEDHYGAAFERMQEVIGGRDAADLDPEEFWGPLNRQLDTIGGREVWQQDNILAADLITGSLMKQLRDRAMVARELVDIADLNDIDGPLKSIRDNLVVGMEMMKRSRFLASEAYHTMLSQKGGKGMADQALLEMHATTKNQVDMMLDMARQSPSDDFLHAVLEAFSMSNKIHNWQDFDNYMHNKLVGVTLEDGTKQTGAITRELQGVMINSILSGPKTPLRAIMGTSTAVFTRPMSQTLGGIMRYASTGGTDASSLKQALGSANAMVQSIPESWKYFQSRLSSYWAGDINTIKSRYQQYTLADEHWDLVGHWAETRGTDGEKAAFRVTNIARAANQSNFLTYSTKLMAATDDAFTMILARARAKEKAMQLAWNAKGDGILPEVTPAIIKEYETRLYNEIFDPSTGVVSDNMLKYARGEATLSKDISGFGKSMDELFSKNPAIKPFYLFARTGINGLELTMKHVPGLNFFVKEFNDIAFANPEDLSKVAKYGIETAEDLINAKALQNGRLALGSSVMFMAGQHYLNGNLTGNGPADITLKKVWMDAGWVPRSIRIGDAWISYESFEPFNLILSGIADLGDNQRLMGDEWVEKGMLSYAAILAKGVVSKTHLQGFDTLADLFSNDPKKVEKILAGLANNTIPLAGLRNEIGRVITPHMRELNSGFEDQLRNRNLFMEQLAGEDKLPIKYDILNGRPIRDWDVPTRMFNAISPIQLNFDQSDGRKLLFRSNYDLRTSTMTSPDGVSLRDSNSVRSIFQKALGDQDLESKLTKLAKDPLVLESLEQMENDIRLGNKKINPMTYRHNKMIRRIMDRARRKAWATIQTNPDVAALVRANQLEAAADFNRISRPGLSQEQLDKSKSILEMTNR
tara:strand:+ start:5206 stop:9180 length:3975 start_codon:yes stop_codon:yes gene_type:complete